MPAAARLGQRVRRAARPRRGELPLRPHGHHGARLAALHPGHHGARDHLDGADRLDGGARRARDRSLAPRPRARELAPPPAGRLRRRARAAEARPLRAGHRRAEHAVRARVRLRAPLPGLGVDRGRLPPGRREGEGGGRPRASARHRPAGGVRGTPLRGANDAAGGPDGLRGHVLGGRPRAAAQPRGRGHPHRPDQEVLAPVAGSRRIPGPPMARVPAAQRAHPEGAHVRAHRGDRGGGHHVAARDAGRGAQLGLPLRLDP